MKTLIRGLSILCVIGLLACSGLCVDLLIYAYKPAHTVPIRKTFVLVPGQGVKHIAAELYQEGLITRPIHFELLARVKGCDRNIKAGEYDLSPVMAPNRILDLLVSGTVRLHKITIPEGFNLVQIASALDEAELVDASEFKTEAGNPDFLRRLNIPATSPEGYLFPDTYHFPKGMPAREIISAMVDRFNTVVTPEWRQTATKLGFSMHNIVTLASIIEKETGAPSERPIISSVFHNRLKKSMRLESDPTVIYGIDNFDGNLTRRHLNTRTAYNTYKIKGLPPGPIANPGLKSLEAALYPADTRYLYFVARKDRTHQFSTNIRDHNRAVRKYQLRK